MNELEKKILEEINKAGLTTIDRVLNKLNLTRSAISSFRKLGEKGYIKDNGFPISDRWTEVKITPKGKKAIK